MNDRTGLIERAAALLQDGDRFGSVPRPANPAQPAAAPAAAPPAAAPVEPLRRSLILDRAHLAQVGIVMPWTATSRVVEEFRIVKRNIMFGWNTPDAVKPANREPRVVMVTSAKPREGKTFSSINLALAFAAEENLVTILIDGDAVRGDTARLLKIPAEPGFTGVLSGELSLSDALIQTDLPKLVALAPGLYGPHVPELLTGRRPSDLFAEIAERYPDHVIVIDMPPCLASTDPAALAPIVSQVVFVVEAGHTQRTEIESSLSLISGCHQVSFLLNKASAASSEHFGAYSYYYQPDRK